MGLLVLPCAVYFARSQTLQDAHVVDRVGVFVAAPVQWVLVHTLDGVANLWHRYVALMATQHDNVRLHADNARLKAQLVHFEELRRENERLRRLVDLRSQIPQIRTLGAQVIATSPSPLFRSVRIDRGQSDGVRLGAAVLTYDGVVGRVAVLNDRYADVVLMVDTHSSTDVLVQRTRVRARVRGQGGDDRVGMDVSYLPRTADVQPGDVLVTGGLGRTFPKGLQVGRILSVEQRAFGLYQRAWAQPSVSFERLEEVMVVVPFSSPQESPESETSALFHLRTSFFPFRIAAE